MVNELVEKVLNNKNLADKDIDFLIKYENVEELCRAAKRIKEYFFGLRAEFCSIINAKSGRCSEDCKFCAQSAHYKTEVEEYGFLDIRLVEAQAKLLKDKRVKRFSIVTSGKSPSEKDLGKIEKSIEVIRHVGLIPDISVGILNDGTLERLKKAGLSGLHHNLEVAKSFFKNICTTHEYEEDVQTVKKAIEKGFYVCSGGIFGLGESWDHRVELAETLKSLGVHSVPINFLNPIKGTPLEYMPVLTEEEALKIVALFRFLLPDKDIRICGGRNRVFSSRTKIKLLNCGVSGIMVGNYLTTLGFDIEEDLKDVDKLNLILVS